MTFLSGAKVLSFLDALSGFIQLEMAEEDVDKTAFWTHKGLFQFKRMLLNSLTGHPSSDR